ncbi:NDUFAF3 isoform 7 [Pan troglodytes]|uniref:NDUFAF3 isoform 7 n=1 Tax=Pan troglodytes TaxID=9598 RepID=A0A2J8P9L5_PANTR|nr:NDUFAF3 isoform 7 [Pan troglodytes]
MATALALRSLYRARPSLRCPPVELPWAPRRGHRLSPADDELYQRTRISLLQREAAQAMYIDSYNSRGFMINGNRVLGPCALLPHSVVQWNVGSHQDITEESFSLFWLLEPRIDRGGGDWRPDREAAVPGASSHEAAGHCCGSAGHAQCLCHLQLPVS